LESVGGDVGVGPIVFEPANGLPKGNSDISITSSVDGSRLAASSFRGIYTSKDYGKNWNLTAAPTKYY
jgi:hypothetical protein